MSQDTMYHNSDTTALVALGSNLPEGNNLPEKILRLALAELEGPGIAVAAVSRFYHTPCFPAGAGPDYVNAAAILSVSLPPEAVLARLHAIEAAHGRERVQRWGSRVLDLDLLAYGDRVVPDGATYAHWHDLTVEEQKLRAPDALILPHPRLHERAFVLVPLADVAPDWRHPVLGQSVREMLDRLPKQEKEQVIALGEA